MDSQSLCTFVATSAYLFLKMFANSGVQGYARMRGKTPKYREDKMFFGTEHDSAAETPELLQRADACWRNDLENIPVFLVAALCGLLTGVPHSLYLPLMLLFCVGRTLQTVSLLLALQPWRFFGYVAGVVSTGAMFVLALRQLGW
jgi:uncharacterized MAPEG superfamily protein